MVRPFYAVRIQTAHELTLYSGHLIIAAKKTWPMGGWIIEVPRSTLYSTCTVHVHVHVLPRQYLYFPGSESQKNSKISQSAIIEKVFAI